MRKRNFDMSQKSSPVFRLAVFSLVGFSSLLAGSTILAANEELRSETQELRSYTTVGLLDQKEIWVASALKKGMPAFPHPYLQRYQAGDKKLSEELSLDAATFEGREVSGIYRMKTPDGKLAIGVLSQWQVEQGDEPILHAIEESKLKGNRQKDWVKLAVAPCVDVLQLEPARAPWSFIVVLITSSIPRPGKPSPSPRTPQLASRFRSKLKGGASFPQARSDFRCRCRSRWRERSARRYQVPASASIVSKWSPATRAPKSFLKALTR